VLVVQSINYFVIRQTQRLHSFSPADSRPRLSQTTQFLSLVDHFFGSALLSNPHLIHPEDAAETPLLTNNTTTTHSLSRPVILYICLQAADRPYAS